MDDRVPLSEQLNDACQELRRRLETSGLGRVADDLMKLALVSIRITVTQRSVAGWEVGDSRFGGPPDLPEGMAWPEKDGIPLALLAQLRLENIAPYDAERLLPRTGMLYFFYEVRAQKWGFDPKDEGHWKVVYYDGDLTKLQPISPPATLPEEGRFHACRVTFFNELTLPSWGSGDLEGLPLSEEEGDRYDEFLDNSCGNGAVIHQLFGHPNEIQGNMQLECQLTSNGIYTGDINAHSHPRVQSLEDGASDWRLLLQVDSDEENMGTMWGDAGRVYYWIREQDLSRLDFSKVWLILQCY
jgi:uncharacterized protein YwqG